MSPQRSNRSSLIDGTLRCLERLPPERVTARAIAAESGANLASITYHFGSKDDLVTEAVIEGLDRWLDEIDRAMGELAPAGPRERFRRAAQLFEASRQSHTGLAKNFVAALARAQHDPKVREILAEGYRRTRPSVAAILGLGDDRAAEDAAGLALALFHGLMFQALLDPALTIEGRRMVSAQIRFAELLPDGSRSRERSARPA
jgi:AcrR family transcriptional regulator